MTCAKQALPMVRAMPTRTAIASARLKFRLQVDRFAHYIRIREERLFYHENVRFGFASAKYTPYPTVY
jgi:hypothetical protein